MSGWLVDDADPAKSVPGGGVICGIGVVSGTRCMITVNDAGINAGAIQRMGGDKLLRAQAIAMENKLPFVQLIESAGANLLQYKVEGFVNGGRLFYNLARLSAAGIPVIGLVHGSSTAGGAYMPGLSDYVIMVRGRAKAFLAGPPLLKAATGEIAGDEELGGAEMHTAVSGLGDYLAEDDADALRIARELLARLKWQDGGPPSAINADPSLEPAHPTDELAGVVPLDFRTPIDMREVIARLVDRSEFTEFGADYGGATLCGHAALYGGQLFPVCPALGGQGAASARQFAEGLSMQPRGRFRRWRSGWPWVRLVSRGWSRWWCTSPTAPCQIPSWRGRRGH